MTQVFSTVANDTPALTPGWTVQTGATGSDQSLVSNAGAGPNSGTAVGYTVQTPASTANTQTGSYVQADVQSIATAVNSINTKLTAAGIF